MPPHCLPLPHPPSRLAHPQDFMIWHTGKNQANYGKYASGNSRPLSGIWNGQKRIHRYSRTAGKHKTQEHTKTEKQKKKRAGKKRSQHSHTHFQLIKSIYDTAHIKCLPKYKSPPKDRGKFPLALFYLVGEKKKNHLAENGWKKIKHRDTLIAYVSGKGWEGGRGRRRGQSSSSLSASVRGDSRPSSSYSYSHSSSSSSCLPVWLMGNVKKITLTDLWVSSPQQPTQEKPKG